MSDIKATEIVQRIEAALAAPGESSRERARSRRTIAVSLQELASIEIDPSRSICGALEAIATERGRPATHALGALTIRLINSPAILSPGDQSEARRHIVRLIEAGCSDLASTVQLDNKAQSHDRLEAYQTLHSRACEGLNHLLPTFTSLHDVSGHRPLMLKALNHGPSKRYLNTFGFASVLSSVSSLLKLVDDVVESQGHQLQQRTQSLLESVVDDISQYEADQTFIARDYMCPFLNLLEEVTRTSQTKMAAEFACTITPPQSPYELEKRYPLHVGHSTIRVLVPMTNSGPGAALDVRAYYLTDSGDSDAQFGDVQPGPFLLDLHVNIGEPRERLHLEVEVHWRTVGDPREHTVGFSVVVLGQRTDLDWDYLSLQQPYSLEVAYDQEFYGRKDAVRRLLRGLAPNRMQSFYITGQKRVGKSSLAHAVETRLLDAGQLGKYRVLYRECGEFRHSSGEQTLRALGDQLEEFLCQSLPPTMDSTGADYSSSLTHLNRLLEQLLRLDSELRFVIILDEFDEINEALYRYGELASTFFLNLRTLSSKREFGLCVGGRGADAICHDFPGREVEQIYSGVTEQF